MLRHLAALFGPIFIKEIVDIARRWRYYISRVLYALVLLVILAIVYEEVSRYHRYRVLTVNEMARIAQELFMAASIVQYCAVFVFVPMFVCGAVAGEREERTLDLLFATHLSDREIVLGKLASRVAALATLIFCGLPVLSLMLLYGGIDPGSLWRVLASTGLAILFVGAHAIYFSVTTAGTLGALVRTYWWLALGILGLPLLGAVALDDAPGWFVARVFGVLAFVNPAGPFVVSLEGMSYNFMVRFFGPWFFPATFLVPMAWSLFLLWRAVVRVRQTPAPILQWLQRVRGVRRIWQWWNRPEAMARRARVAHRAWLGRFLLHPFWLRVRLGMIHEAAQGVGVVHNPLWLRARLAPVYDRTGHIGLIQWAGIAFVVIFLALMTVFNSRDLGDEEMSMGVVGMTWAAVAALAALFAGTSLVGDRRRGFLELVLVTPLTGRDILDGAFLAIWEHVRPLFVLAWPLALFFCFTGASLPWGAAASCITATLFCWLLVWHGIACSAAARTIPAALIATFLFPLIVLVGPVLFAGIFEDRHGPVLWILCPILVVASGFWARRRFSLGALATYFTSVHLALAVLATFWTYDGRRDEFPAVAMHPGVLVVIYLDDRIDPQFQRMGLPWFALLPGYWLALVVSVIWLRLWLIRHFDRLAERTSAERPIHSQSTSTCRWERSAVVTSPSTNAAPLTSIRRAVEK
ncbi:MAG: ABC transporter permease [Gemmataceae bacterium]|nr:ABC transporter permease [Gemmataceae bacterium]